MRAPQCSQELLGQERVTLGCWGGLWVGDPRGGCWMIKSSLADPVWCELIGWDREEFKESQGNG